MADKMPIYVKHVNLDCVLYNGNCYLVLESEVCPCFEKLVETVNNYHWVVIVHEL